MVVQHNMQALNANRMLGITTSAQAKSTEKLSSGYKINRAADDAAGLSISEKMRKQIKGLDQASTNAQDGISAVQTAEGALTEVHAMLQRMNELAVQAANGTNSETDRQSIQDEIEQLTTEIDRVAETTKFNEAYLLKGNGKSTIVQIDAKDAGIEGALTGVGTGHATFKMDELKTGEQITIGSKGYTIGSSVDEIRKHVEPGKKVTINGKAYTVAEENGSNIDETENILSKEVIDTLISDGDNVVIGSDKYVAMVDGKGEVLTAASDVKTEIGKLNDGDKVTIDGTEFTVGTGTAALAKDADTTGTAANVAAKAVADSTIRILDAQGTAITFDDAASNGVTQATVKASTSNAGEIAAGSVEALLQNGYSLEVTVNGKATTYKVDANGGTLADAASAVTTGTKGSIEDLIADGQSVTVAGKTYKVGTPDPTAVAADGVGDNDASVITKEKAYELIAKELEIAGSVGADPGREAEIETQKLDKDGKVLGADATEDELAAAKDALYYIEDGKAVFKLTEGTVETTQGLQFSLHVGADADENNKIALTIDAMDTTSLGVSGINVVDNTGAKATYAIDSIADAIAKVSAQRSALGAIQNRLEHTIANLDNVVENTTAAESEIRDTDMAEQMVDYSKNNILMQAGQSMLTQANQATQGVLSLLG